MKGLGVLCSLIATCAPVYTPYRERFPRGVVVEGVAVGGLTREKGEAKIREKLRENAPVLRVVCGEKHYAFTYPELDFTDGLDEVFLFSKPKGRYAANAEWYLKGEEDILGRIAFECGRKTKDALVCFTAEGFFYEHEQTGLVPDSEAFRKELVSALSSTPVNGEFPSVEVRMRAEYPTRTVEALKEGTKKLSSCRTYYDESNAGRSENIRLAARFLNGKTLLAGEEFSFNKTVGERTKRRGFCEANIIEGGKFVKGTGGGVCQVSTTLYVAASESGMKVIKRSPHSLPVSYISPSCDAMVSSRSDFCFQNPYPYPVYLSVRTGRGWIEATFYGKRTGYSYKLCSVKTGEIQPPEPEIEYGEREEEVKEGRAGITSEGYLETYFQGALVSRKRVSRDTYAPTRGVVRRKRERNDG